MSSIPDPASIGSTPSSTIPGSSKADEHLPCPLPTTLSTKSFWHSDPSPLLLGHRSTRNLPRTADVVVIGSGITGASVAWHLLADANGKGTGKGGDGKGPNVLMLEAREACWGATGRNGGHCHPMIYLHPSDPSVGSFELANYNAIASLISTLSLTSAEFRPVHGVRGIYTPTDLASARHALGILAQHDSELASHARIVTDKSELAGPLRLPTALGAIVTDTAASMWPYKFVAGVLERLITDTGLDGCFNLQTHTAAAAIEKVDEASGVDENGSQAHGYAWKVRTERGDVYAKKIVLATNAYTSHLLPQYADLIVPCRGQMSALVPPATASGDARLTTSYGFLGGAQDDYLVQRPSDRGEHLMFGGGRQCDGDTIGNADDSVTNPETAAYLRRELSTLLGLGREGEELVAVDQWTGVMGFSRDDRPWTGPVPGCPGLFLSAGYTGHGMPNAWLCGKAVGRMVGSSSDELSEEHLVDAAVAETGLPRSYLATEARVSRARQLVTVLEQDHATMFKPEMTT